MPNPLERYRDCDTADLLVAFDQLGALERTARAQRALVLAILDERGAWADDGAADVVGWVAAADAVHRSTARGLVDHARAFASLPAVASTACDGALSSDQLRYVVALASPDTDSQWAHEAPGMSPDHLRRLVAVSRREAPGDAAERHRRRSVRWWYDERIAMVRIAGRLPADAAAVVTAALERIAEQSGPGPDGLWEPFESRCADALVDLASTSLAADADHDRACVVVHTTLDGLQRDGTDVATLDDATPLPVEVARRLACDAVRQAVATSADGAWGVGRKTRTVAPWLRRLLRQRDGHCRFPGCDRHRGAHAHHVRHWADGGTTDDANLVLLCPRHHQAVHELGWQVTGDPTRSDGLTFQRPDGRIYHPAPQPLRPDLRHRYLGPDPPTSER